MFAEFVENYGMEIIMAILTAIAGAVGMVLKNLYTKFVNDKTKQSVVKTVVQGVEQIYKDLHGEEKYEKALEAASEMLSEKGISVTELELKMLIEAAVGEFNDVFYKWTSTEDASTIGFETEHEEQQS